MLAVSVLATQVAEEAAVRRGGGGNVDVDMEKGGGGGADEVAFKYPEEPVVKLDPSQHVLYCCPSKDPTEQNCGEDAVMVMVVMVLSADVDCPVVVAAAAMLLDLDTLFYSNDVIEQETHLLR